MTSKTGVLLRPLENSDWPAEISGMLAGFAGQLNVYRTMAHNPALMRAWADLRDHIVRGSTLGAELSEVTILRTGFRHGSDYEWVHHVVRSHAVGLAWERIHSIRGEPEDMLAVDAAIASAVDDLLQNSRISVEVQERLADHVGPKGILDVIATVGFYSTLAFILNSFNTPIDADVADRFERLQDRSVGR